MFLNRKPVSLWITQAVLVLFLIGQVAMVTRLTPGFMYAVEAGVSLTIIVLKLAWIGIIVSYLLSCLILIEKRIPAGKWLTLFFYVAILLVVLYSDAINSGQKQILPRLEYDSSQVFVAAENFGRNIWLAFLIIMIFVVSMSDGVKRYFNAATETTEKDTATDK